MKRLGKRKLWGASKRISSRELFLTVLNEFKLELLAEYPLSLSLRTHILGTLLFFLCHTNKPSIDMHYRLIKWTNRSSQVE